MSLLYQIHNGKKEGCSGEEICAAVSKAITPGSSLRNYLESQVYLDEKCLIKVTLVKKINQYSMNVNLCSQTQMTRMLFVKLGHLAWITAMHSSDNHIRRWSAQSQAFTYI